VLYIAAFFALLLVCTYATTNVDFIFADMFAGSGYLNGAHHDEDHVDPAEADCSFIDFDNLRTQLRLVVCDSSSACPNGFVGADANAGLGLNMWATVVNRYGRVCAVVYSGTDNTQQWPGSRVISAQKANTANAFSLDALALSSANLYGPTLPGGTLHGLAFSNPVDTTVAYGGESLYYGYRCGTDDEDPMCGKKIGGINTFGGGLGLYDSSRKIVGGLGVSGDTSCADHIIAWKLRNALALDYVNGGVGGAPGYDNILFPETVGFGHPICSAAAQTMALSLPSNYPVNSS